ncbi:MAG: glycosyl transferase family 4, partial [Alphaproteobacteria bacterium]|nr:glycosyl transferase family 4 [Alphaproteobacteria bacterium]
MPFYLLAMLATGIVSYGLSIVVQRQSERLGLVKAPNERSSHIIPTARGGGAGIAVAGIAGSGLMAVYGMPILYVVCLLGAV